MPSRIYFPYEIESTNQGCYFYRIKGYSNFNGLARSDTYIKKFDDDKINKISRNTFE